MTRKTIQYIKMLSKHQPKTNVYKKKKKQKCENISPINTGLI